MRIHLVAVICDAPGCRAALGVPDAIVEQRAALRRADWTRNLDLAADRVEDRCPAHPGNKPYPCSIRLPGDPSWDERPSAI